MPLYEFNCINEQCRTGLFEELCTWEQIPLIRCPNCNTTKIEKTISQCSIKFTQARDSSKWDNFGYRADYLLERAKEERRAAEAKSHMGMTPFQDAEKLDLGKMDLEATEGKISDNESEKFIAS